MKNQTFIATDETIDALYKEFVANENIISMSHLRRIHGYGSKSGAKVQLAIYKKFGEEMVKKICRSRCAKFRRSKVTGTYRPSTKTLKLRSDSIKKTWANNPRLLQIAINNGKNTKGRIQSDAEKLKRANSLRGKRRTVEQCRNISKALLGRPLSDAHRAALRVKKKTFRTGFKLTSEHKQKLSKKAKREWENGTHTPTYRSKGQIEMENIVQSLGEVISPEHLVGGRPFDTYIKRLNLLLEFNGTYWHRDPRFYKATEDVVQVWNNDTEKHKLAIDLGYKVHVVWQHDWEKCKDKPAMIESIIKQHEQ